MKKILAFILALVMCLGIFAGCGSEPAPTQAPETTPVETEPAAPDTSAEDLESAAAYVKALYKRHWLRVWTLTKSSPVLRASSAA